ncbi:DUF2484 family protein [Sulfitobacter sp. M72]|uniref:DUF2484 family protein n=1 Tax=Sulfitobacter sp. M72 TaxID=2731176 RepID=UPI003204B1F7
MDGDTMMLMWMCILWVFASVAVAMLPMRRQYVPGIALLLAAPVLIFFVGQQHGWVMAVLGLAAFVSMFRNPLKFILAKLRGQNPQVPQ